jgi:hypothetical protein
MNARRRELSGRAFDVAAERVGISKGLSSSSGSASARYVTSTAAHEWNA